jgi:outer membrane protein assembly factor BamB
MQEEEKMKAFRSIFIKSATFGFAAVLLFAISMQGICQDADRAVTYQITTEHNGCITTSPELLPPLVKKWSIDLGYTVSYPLIAEGKVFVTVGNIDSYCTKLYAINAETGEIAWGPVLISLAPWSGAAYGDGRIYVVDYNGEMMAFLADNGSKLWHIKLPVQYFFSSPPTFRNGIVYTGGAGFSGALYAVDAASGTVIWMQGVWNGDKSSPAVTDDGVYVTYAGGISYKFDPNNGSQIWMHDTGYSGSGGNTPVIYDGRLYSNDHYPTFAGFALDTSTGAYRGGYDTQTTPAFYNGSGYVIYNGNLQRMVSNLAIMWTSTLTELVTPPIIVNGVVYIGSSDGYLFAVDPDSGLPFWSDNVGATILAPDEQDVTSPVSAMGAGEGIIVVPASNLLVAYGGASGNDSPVVTCTPPAEVECSSPGGTQYTINAEVSDSDGGPLTVKWFVDGDLVQTDTTNGGETDTISLSMTYTYPLGMYDILVEVSDGNNPTVSASTSVNVVDSTSPEVSVSVAETTLNTPNRKMVDIGFSASIMDIVDTNPAFSTAVYSDEDDICGTAGPDMSPDAVWTPNLMLRMECNPQGDGRVYLVVITAIDESGNKSYGCTTVTVPKSSSQQSISSVKTQAQEAMDYCLANGGAAPAGFFVVGDGPQTGKK